MIYSDYKIYGPYKRKDGRYHVILIHLKLKTRKTVSYPKYLVEVFLGKELLTDDTVDHIDGDFNNNDISNLRIVKIREHASDDAMRNQDYITECVYCNKTFTIKGSKISGRGRRNAYGPFCSKQCTGRYGASVQNGSQALTGTKIIPNKLKSI